MARSFNDPGQHFDPKGQRCGRERSPSAPRYDHYTIAWICALYIEMAAARAILDEIHEVRPKGFEDTNSYVLGNIKGHNIVIACLPVGQYGTNNAATVATNLKRTFPGIHIGLMVGIGGGVPSKADIRLGDVVVGTKVVQFDLGKIMGDGKFERTAIPKTPDQLLGTTIAKLRSKHEYEPSRALSILQQSLITRPDSEYNQPSTPDQLFQATYEHRSQLPNCNDCDQSRLISRGERVPKTITIHYGAIASGNQVMRHGTTRDNIARELDTICFEMEAAGLMNVLPFLPIRGICDYSDSHKTKEWQKYAAATAAAYARELIEELPMAEDQKSACSASSVWTPSSTPEDKLFNSFHNSGGGVMNVNTGSGTQNNNNGGGNQFSGAIHTLHLAR
ncbi:hypothetical protein PENSTE_c006G02143 [Penicillium steckii]|uniref:Nucleoside phosphorylase domain-containing protein n=1 Tax=Penicillium steckii TaxID=303698 RepID=A0A1V6TFW1_9EURO|nr:hypothetical protein PENSTE_c006G02143 [Penicillium steckii]